MSRNRTFGEKLGLGLLVAEIAASTQRVGDGVDLPIVAYVVRGEMMPVEMLRSLVSRSAKPERHGW